MLKAEALSQSEVMFRTEFASRSDYSPTFQFEMVVKPENYSTVDSLPSGLIGKTEVASISQESFGVGESFTLEEPGQSRALLGPEMEAMSKSYLDQSLCPEVGEPQLEGDPCFQEKQQQQSNLFAMMETQHPTLVTDPDMPPEDEPLQVADIVLKNLQNPSRHQCWGGGSTGPLAVFPRLT